MGENGFSGLRVNMGENSCSRQKVNMAENETSCIDLGLSDGGRVYLKSTWETTNFSIVVLDGVRAWSRTVSAKEVVSIATAWKIDVGEFMKSARSHLCRQHPTSSYSIPAEKDADVVQLSFTIDDLLEGDEGKETLNFDLRLARISDVGAVVRDMLDHLLVTKNMLKEQLSEAENEFQEKLHELAASEPEPSITLSIARPSANPRRQSPSFVEPCLLDFTKFNHAEERDTTRSVCTLTPMRAHDQLQHDTPKVSTRLPPPPSFDLQDHGTKQMANSTVEMEREPVSFFKDLPRSRAANESRIGVRNNDLTVHAREAYVGFDGPLDPNIMRVLDTIGVAGTIQRNGIDRGHGRQNLHNRRDEGEMTTEGVKITEMRSPARREEQGQRSFMVETNPVSIDLSSMTNSTNGCRNLFESTFHEEEGSRRTTTILRQKNIVPEGQPKLNSDIGADFTRPVKYNSGLVEDIAYQKGDAMNWSAFSEKKNLQENHNRNDVNGGILEKGSSNAEEPGQIPVRDLNKFAEDEANEGSDEEPTSKVTVEDVHLSRSNSDSGLRAKAGFSEKPRGQWSNEARSTELKREKYQEQQKLADKEPREPVRHEFPDGTRNHSAEKRSLKSLWSRDVIGSTVFPSIIKSDKKSLVTDTPEYARQKSSCSHLPVVEHQCRKRTAEDKQDDFNGKTLRSVKVEIKYPDLEGPEGNETYGCRGAEKRTARIFNTKVKHEVVDLEEYPEEVQQYSEDGGKFAKGEIFHNSDAPPGFARSTIADLLKRIPVVGGEGRGRGSGRGRGRGRGSMQGQLRAGDSSGEKRPRRRLRCDRSPSEEGNVLDPDETNVDNFDVPDPDYYNFDKERTEELILPNQIWAVYDEKDGLPRVWARVNKISGQPKFEVAITWLTPYDPSVDAENWHKTTGYPVSCGKFEHGSQHVLTSINMFSHRMEFNWLAENVVTIFPRKGEVWALYTTKTIKSASANPDTGAKNPKFRVVHLLEDVEPEKRPVFSVLERVKGFRTVYQAHYDPGSVAFSYLVVFSHRVPAYQLKGNEGPMAANLKGSWDVDPAGLPNIEGDI